MDKRKKRKLASRGWKTGSVAEFLNLSAEESAYIEMKLALSNELRERRKRNKLTQAELAEAIESSQSRVAKMEAGDPTVSIDLLVKSLLALGVSRKELGRTISWKSRDRGWKPLLRRERLTGTEFSRATSRFIRFGTILPIRPCS